MLEVHIQSNASFGGLITCGLYPGALALPLELSTFSLVTLALWRVLGQSVCYGFCMERATGCPKPNCSFVHIDIGVSSANWSKADLQPFVTWLGDPDVSSKMALTEAGHAFWDRLQKRRDQVRVIHHTAGSVR
jgi:hypothetical protein